MTSGGSVGFDVSSLSVFVVGSVARVVLGEVCVRDVFIVGEQQPLPQITWQSAGTFLGIGF